MTELRHDWQFHEIAALYDLPFFELIYQAHSIHRNNFPEHPIQLSTLLSIKTGTCPEDCAYCPQSGHYQTGVNKQKLMDKDEVIAKAKQAQAMGATRFCMGAAWRSPPQNEFLEILEMIQEIKKLGLESCVTLGMLTEEQAEQLKEAGLDYYNHNIDTSPAYYEKIITTRTFADRIETLKNLRKADIKVCCGGIMGLGETRSDRIEFLLQLSNLPEHPESVPINRLIAIKGTPLEKLAAIDNFEFVRTIAIARIIMPVSVVRLSAGRESMSEEMQALCFFAGANSIHYGERLLTANNPDQQADMLLIKKLGLQVMTGSVE